MTFPCLWYDYAAMTIPFSNAILRLAASGIGARAKAVLQRFPALDRWARRIHARASEQQETPEVPSVPSQTAPGVQQRTYGVVFARLLSASWISTRQARCTCVASSPRQNPAGSRAGVFGSSGAKRGAERWFHIVTDERQSLWPEPPCALRVTAASGHLPRCHSSIDGGHRLRRGASHMIQWRS